MKCVVVKENKFMKRIFDKDIPNENIYCYNSKILKNMKNKSAQNLAYLRHKKTPRTPQEIAKMSKAGVEARKKKREQSK